ncbi:MAG: hypothetical protein J6Q83_01105 [Clostridia bacterium]|nr:hypothetical protein [Clostridia bacterium]
MGLFSNKKNPCVLCGEPTPRIFAKEACGGKLCSDCGKKISVQDDILTGFDLDALKQHMQYREENEKIYADFRETRRFSVDGETLVIDDVNKQFYFSSFDGKNKPVFKFSELVGFAYVEDMESKFDNFVSSNKLFLRGSERLIHEKGLRVVYEYTKEYKKKQDSFLDLYIEENRGVAYSKNLVNHILGLDDELISREKPVKQMYLVFELSNPYWHIHRKNLFEPSVPNYNSEDKTQVSIGRQTYINRYKDKLDEIKDIAAAAASILDA